MNSNTSGQEKELIEFYARNFSPGFTPDKNGKISHWDVKGKHYTTEQVIRAFNEFQPPTSTDMKQEVPPNIVAFKNSVNGDIMWFEDQDESKIDYLDRYDQWVEYQLGGNSPSTIHTIQLPDGKQFSVGDRTIHGKILYFKWDQNDVTKEYHWYAKSEGGYYTQASAIVSTLSKSPSTIIPEEKKDLTEQLIDNMKESFAKTVETVYGPEAATPFLPEARDPAYATLDLINWGKSTPPPIHKGEEEMGYGKPLTQDQVIKKHMGLGVNQHIRRADAIAAMNEWAEIECDKLKSLPSNALREALGELVSFCKDYYKVNDTMLRLIRQGEAALNGEI